MTADSGFIFDIWCLLLLGGIAAAILIGRALRRPRAWWRPSRCRHGWPYEKCCGRS